MEQHRGYIELILETKQLKYLLKIGQSSSLFKTFSSWKFLVCYCQNCSTASIHLTTLLSIPALLFVLSLGSFLVSFFPC